jgi:hypothetical protein
VRVKLRFQLGSDALKDISDEELAGGLCSGVGSLSSAGDQEQVVTVGATASRR